jgi:hypothetical protein
MPCLEARDKLFMTAVIWRMGFHANIRTKTIYCFFFVITAKTGLRSVLVSSTVTERERERLGCSKLVPRFTASFAFHMFLTYFTSDKSVCRFKERVFLLGFFLYRSYNLTDSSLLLAALMSANSIGHKDKPGIYLFVLYFNSVSYFESKRKCKHLRYIYIPYILESNPHPFYSFRGIRNRMRIRIECGLDSRSRAWFWKNDRAGLHTRWSLPCVSATVECCFRQLKNLQRLCGFPCPLLTE